MMGVAHAGEGPILNETPPPEAGGADWYDAVDLG